MTELSKWHPGEMHTEVAENWQKEPDICRALELAAAEDYYAKYCGYDRLLLAAKEEIERLQSELSEIESAAADLKY